MARARILIAEDETIIAMDIEKILTRLGYDVVGIASSGEESLSIAEKKRPELVLMDILFRGGMDGIKAATEMRKRLDIPVIYLTANADQATVERARQSEPFGYLNKPINEQDLFSNIDTALYKHAMEKRLIESRERYRSLIEDINDVIFATDGEGLLIYVSPPITPVMGYLPKELLGIPFHKFIHPEDLHRIETEFSELREGIINPSEYRIISKSGDAVWIRSSSKPLIVNGTFQGIRGILTDITERKMAEELQILQRDLAIDLGTVKELGAALAMVLDAAIKIEYADCGGIYLTDQATGSLELAVHRGLSRVFVDNVTRYGPESIQGQIAKSRKPLHGNFPALIPANANVVKDEGIQAISAVPISHEDRNIALLVLASHSIIEFPSRTRNAIETIAAQTGSVLANLQVDKALIEFQDRLKSQEERLRFLLDNMIDIIFQVNSDREFTYVTPSIHRILGYDPADIVGKPALDLAHPDDVHEFTSELDRVEKEKSDFMSSVFRVRHADGRYLWMEFGIKLLYDEGGNNTGAVISSRDITDRRRLENELMQFIKIIETTSDLIFTAISDGSITFINRPGKHLIGWNDGETVIGKKIDDVHPAWAMKIIEREGIPSAVKNGIWSGETALQHADGHEIPVSQIIMAHRSSNGDVEFLSSIMRDITNLKKNELEMKYSLKEKEVLLKEIHHRVKNNFQLIMSLLSLQSDRSKNEEVRRELEESCGRIRAMAHMHENLYGSHNLSRIDLSSYLGMIARDLHDTLAGEREGIMLDMDIENISLGISQALPCGLIVNELISNSLRHAFPGDFSGDRKIRLSAKREGDAVTIVVGDNGAGMAGMKALGEAESLGLTLVRILTEQLGGSIHFISDAGTRFTLSFGVQEQP